MFEKTIVNSDFGMMLLLFEEVATYLESREPYVVLLLSSLGAKLLARPRDNSASLDAIDGKSSPKI